MDDLYLWPDTFSTGAAGAELAGLALADLASQHGTPLYLMDEQTVRTVARAYTAGFAGYAGGATVYYACKALLNVAVAQLLAQEGLAFDVVSLGELRIAQHAGVAAQRCHLHGNAKPYDELVQAVEAGIGRIVVDNQHELDTLIAICSERNVCQKIMLRIAPDIAAGGNEKIQTGKSTSKFGFNIEDGGAMSAIGQAHRSETLDLLGLHAHTGSQIRTLEPLKATLRALFDLADKAHQKLGWQMREVSPGGGLAVPINSSQQAMSIADYCGAIVETALEESAKRGWEPPHLSIEPGRSVIARSVVAVYRVTGYKAQQAAPDFLAIDGGIGDNLRPAMYGADYDALSVFRPNSPHTTPYQLAGRYCESGDILIPNVKLTAMQPGDLVALPAAGAYTLSMASNYNGIGRPPLILLQDGQARIIQRRETWEDVILRDRPLD